MSQVQRRVVATVAAGVLALLLAPAGLQAGISLPGGLTYEKTASPGEAYEGSITVINNDPAPRTVRLYQTDYLFYHDGTNVYGKPGEHNRSNARWISFSPKRMVIPAGESLQVNYRVDIPADAVFKGTAWSMLMVEAVPLSSPELDDTYRDELRLGLTQVFRYGVQLVTHVTDEANYDIRFIDTRLVKREDGQRVLRVAVENTGERLMRLKLWTELYDEAGRSLGRVEAGRLRTFPGTSVRFEADLSSLDAGSYQALVVADGGDDHVFGESFTLEVQ